MGSVKRPIRPRAMARVAREYPLESGLALWGAPVGVYTMFAAVPSTTLAQLPSPIDDAWGAMIAMASISVIVGLVKRAVSPFIANAMYLYAMAFGVYAVAIVGYSSFAEAGIVGSLNAILCVICAIRGAQLRSAFKAIFARAKTMESEGRTE